MRPGSLYQMLARPLSPRAETWVRRVFGAGQAVLAVLCAAWAISLFGYLVREHAIAANTGGRSPDPHGFGAMTLVLFVIPSTVLLAFGSASVWRRWSVPWWLPLSVIVALCGAASVALRSARLAG